MRQYRRSRMPDNSDIVLDAENYTGNVIEIEPDQEFCSDYDDSYEHID
jgi:hypothetical protein